VVVVGILFLPVPSPAVHLPAGNLLTAETPAHFYDGQVELEIHPHAGDIADVIAEAEAVEAEHPEVVHFHAVADKPDDLPAHGVYEWAFYVDEELVGSLIDEHGHGVEFEFPEEGRYTVQATLWEEAVGEGEAFARVMTHMPEKSAFPITNTMLTSWITVIVLLLLFGIGMRKRKLIPSGLQNVCELIIESLVNFVEGAAGRENGRRFFPIFATIFLFVITNAWLALVPIFNCIGWGHTVAFDTLFTGESEGFVVTTTLFRSANTDVNLPLAIAIMSFIFVEFWGLSALGFRHYMGKFIKIGALVHGIKGVFKGKPMDLVIGIIETFVGMIELLLEFVRIVSFTFRLFGNMTAGEVLLMVMFFLIPLGWPVIFYGLEVLVGFIQAIVFAGLTLGFAMIAVAPHEEEHE
jgi:F-type H+-transporting ATPase subunit a